MSQFDFKTGSLVAFRDRPWVVQPSEDPDLLLLKPLGGSDEEITGIFKPVADPAERPQSYNFQKPSAADLSDFRSAQLLYDAARLSFRNAAGPFRALAKLSFRPRAYQMVPLIMALRQEVVRLLIADDVGVGKTIEALLIARELYERKEIKRFAVVCLPHLCEQWQEEIRQKFGLEAVIIRGSTISALERKIKANEMVFEAFPFQIISIDFIKTGNKREVFLSNSPELVIVDEAHSCARPAGANNSQQLRYHLLHDLAKQSHKHLIMLTATPHSGKEAEFRSLLGLLKPEFEKIDITESSEAQRKEIARHFVQRRRPDVLAWYQNEDTQFPERVAEEKGYDIGLKYADAFNEILGYARELVSQTAADARKQRYSYWDALALLRGVMSSPAAGVAMLRKKAEKKRLASDADDTTDPDAGQDDMLDYSYFAEDNLPATLHAEYGGLAPSEAQRLATFARQLESLSGLQHDFKLREVLAKTKELLASGFQPIIFCRYIQTANYLGEAFAKEFKGKTYAGLQLEVVTSELDDEQRREKVEVMSKAERRILIATDCLSEGINLQDGFNAIIHYDLPWNPNRLEQREGRIDRFGQQAAEVKVVLMYGTNNPIDGVVLEVLLRKAREIKKATGISVPLPDDSITVMKAITQAILLKPHVSIKQVGVQTVMFVDDTITEQSGKLTNYLEASQKREEISRSIFAQNTIKAADIEDDLREVDAAIGDLAAVEGFVKHALAHLGVQITPIGKGYRLFTTNLPARLQMHLPAGKELLISFRSPTPPKYLYLGRNHPFTEHLCQYLLQASLQRQSNAAARAAVLRTNMVTEKTVLYQMRVRNVMAEQPANRQLVAEEMWLWGYTGEVDEERWLTPEICQSLLHQASPAQNIEDGEKAYWLEEELAWVNDEKRFKLYTDPVALTRAEHLVNSHGKFRKLVGGSAYKVVEPVLPMDVLGIYVFLPIIK